MQEKILQEFREVVSSLRGKQKQSLDAQVDAVIRAKGTRLKGDRRHGLLGVRRFLLFLLICADFCEQIMKIFVRQVLQGKALSLEDAADVLTLQDNGESVENYATALHLLAHAEVCRRAYHGFFVAGMTTIVQGYSRREETILIQKSVV